MDLLSRLKQNFTTSKDMKKPEIQFLEQSELNKVLNRGFVELYKAHPKNPVKYLSKWLYKESKGKELENKYKQNKLKKEKLSLKYKEEQRKNEEKIRSENEKIKKENKNQLALTEDIDKCEEHWENFNNFCERLKKLVNATGVYLGIFDLKRKQVKEDDDETGHIFVPNTEVIRYISWCDDHSFLKGQCLEPSQGVTFNLFQPEPQKNPAQQDEGNNENANPQDNEQNKQNQNKCEIKKDGEFTTLFIDEVINNQKIKFFREPRLGCYFAVEITFLSSLSYTSLSTAIDANRKYLKEKEAQEKKYKDWFDRNDSILKQIEEIKKKLMEEKQKEAEIKENNDKPEEENKNSEEKKDDNPQQVENNNNPNEPKDENQPPKEEEESPEIIELKKQLVEWKEEPVKLGDYEKKEKKLILCLDTIGQDRAFTNEEIDFIKSVSHHIKESLEKHEQKLLEKDRDIRIQFEENENALKESETFSEEKLQAAQDNAVSIYFGSEEFRNKNITDDNIKNIEENVARLKFLGDLMFGGKMYDLLYQFADFEFVEYEKIFQNLFYFAHVDPLQINEVETNKLEWKKGRKIWKDIFSYIKNYEPRGPKPEQVKNIYKLNKIKENLTKAISKREQVKSYSFSLLFLVDYILQIITIRHDDIVQRRNEQEEQKKERERIIKENQEIEEERNKIIEQAKALNQPAEGEKINPPEGQEAQPNPPQEQQPQPQPDDQNQQQGDQQPQFNLEEELAKFDAEHPKTEVPPEVIFDLDLDYDIK